MEENPAEAAPAGEESATLENGPEPRRPRSHKWIALALLAVVAGLAWKTMDPGKLRAVALLLLAFFAFRIAMSSSR